MFVIASILVGLLVCLPESFSDQPEPRLTVSPEDQDKTLTIRGSFLNDLHVPPATNAPSDQATSATFFNGHVVNIDDPNAPANPDKTIFLVKSAFGQSVSRDVPYAGFITDSIHRARALSYYKDAAPGEKMNAAFAILQCLYTNDVSGVHARLFSDIQSLYTEQHRSRALEAERFVRNALRYAPDNADLRQELLDLYYHRALTEQLFAKELLAQVYSIRFDEPPSSGYVIDSEIASYQNILDSYSEALKPYFELLRDPMGVTGSPPFGYTLFRDEVWRRSLYEPTVLISNQFYYVLTNTAGRLDISTNRSPREIVSGHKDLALLLQIEQERCGAVKEYAKLLMARNYAGDYETALTNVLQTLMTAQLEGRLLIEASDLQAHPPAESSGVKQNIARWNQALNELTSLETVIKNRANPLGFTDDFLMIVQSGESDERDSYDYLSEYMVSGAYPPLTRALTKYNAAKQSRSEFKQTQDQLRGNLNQIKSTYYERLVALVGGWNWGHAGDVGALMADSRYTNALTNEGSELWQQVQSMNRAALDIQSAAVEMSNIVDKIQIEVDRRGKAKGIENAMADTYIRYGDKQAKLTPGHCSRAS